MAFTLSLLLLENSLLKCSCKTCLTTQHHSIKDPNHTCAPQPMQMDLTNNFSKLQLD
jgi:hypothetical protein